MSKATERSPSAGLPIRLERHRFETGDFVIHRNGKTFRLGAKREAQGTEEETSYWASILIIGGRPPRRYGRPVVVFERHIQRKVSGNG